MTSSLHSSTLMPSSGAANSSISARAGITPPPPLVVPSPIFSSTITPAAGAPSPLILGDSRVPPPPPPRNRTHSNASPSLAPVGSLAVPELSISVSPGTSPSPLVRSLSVAARSDSPALSPNTPPQGSPNPLSGSPSTAQASHQQSTRQLFQEMRRQMSSPNLTGVKTENESLKKRLAESVKDNADLKAKLKAFEKSHADLQREMDSMRGDFNIGNLQSENASLKRQIENLQDMVSQKLSGSRTRSMSYAGPDLSSPSSFDLKEPESASPSSAPTAAASSSVPESDAEKVKRLENENEFYQNHNIRLEGELAKQKKAYVDLVVMRNNDSKLLVSTLAEVRTQAAEIQSLKNQLAALQLASPTVKTEKA